MVKESVCPIWERFITLSHKIQNCSLDGMIEIPLILFAWMLFFVVLYANLPLSIDHLHYLLINWFQIYILRSASLCLRGYRTKWRGAGSSDCVGIRQIEHQTINTNIFVNLTEWVKVECYFYLWKLLFVHKVSIVKFLKRVFFWNSYSIINAKT